MARQRSYLTLPDLGLGDAPVTASMWLVEPRREVTEGDRLLEVAAGDVTVDLPAPHSGLLTEQLVAEDDQLEIGQRLAVIEVDDRVEDDSADDESV